MTALALGVGFDAVVVVFFLPAAAVAGAFRAFETEAAVFDDGALVAAGFALLADAVALLVLFAGAVDGFANLVRELRLGDDDDAVAAAGVAIGVAVLLLVDFDEDKAAAAAARAFFLASISFFLWVAAQLAMQNELVLLRPQ